MYSIQHSAVLLKDLLSLISLVLIFCVDESMGTAPPILKAAVSVWRKNCDKIVEYVVLVPQNSPLCLGLGGPSGRTLGLNDRKFLCGARIL
jgi:hypothetical protein